MRFLAANKRLLLAIALLCAMVASALAVIYVSHLNRHAFSQYQVTLKERDQLDIEWGQLLLEQSALAQHARVEQIARDRLAMKAPKGSETILVQW